MAPQIVHVTSPNEVFRHLELLKRSQPTRRRFGEFFVEGVKSIDRARAHAGEWPIRSLVYAAGRPLSGWARETLEALPDARRIELSPGLMERLSEKHNPSELVAVVAMPPDAPERIRPRSDAPAAPDALVVVLDRPSSPGNLGSVIRSCHAFGADGLIVTGHGTDIYNPLTVRASMGSLFEVSAVRLRSHREVARWVGDVAHRGGRGASAQRMQIVGASADATLPVDAVDLTEPTVLVFGNEGEGLSAGYRGLCDVVVRIPMRREADSINVACAAAVVLYEVDRQRRARSRPRRKR